MSKNDIRLRRHKLTARGAERFRNYGAVLQRHEEEKRMKKILRVFSFFLIILILLVLIVIVVRIERKVVKKTATEVSVISKSKAGW
jgi:cell division septal protein FtsQ